MNNSIATEAQSHQRDAALEIRMIKVYIKKDCLSGSILGADSNSASFLTFACFCKIRFGQVEGVETGSANSLVKNRSFGLLFRFKWSAYPTGLYML
jgi:hypothetical protein